mmetsp:Transcript_4615/g.12883  ORF Transcript_4615/g.12883 Transcript_4615/m.12883 type:complete len:313 (-) Transcript_4615:186-1124(-)
MAYPCGCIAGLLRLAAPLPPLGRHCRDREGRYVLGEVLGRGTFGTVMAAKDLQYGSDCVLKIVERLTAADAAKQDREAEIHKALNHPNIAKVFETFSGALQVCIVMELCKGGELFDALEEQCHGRTCSEEESRHIFRQVMCAVSYMHEHGLAHRDLKLENFLIEERDAALSTCTIKLIDFGLAARFRAGIASFKTACGSPHYMAPEIFSGVPYCEKCDVWSCGVVLFTLLSGSMPFDGESTQELIQNIWHEPVRLHQEAWKSVSRDAQELVVRTCCKAVDRRPSSNQVATHPWLLTASRGDGAGHKAGCGGA